MSTKAGGTENPLLFTSLWIRQILFVIFYGRILCNKIALLCIEAKLLNGLDKSRHKNKNNLQMKRYLLSKMYSYMTVIVMCPKQ